MSHDAELWRVFNNAFHGGPARNILDEYRIPKYKKQYDGTPPSSDCQGHNIRLKVHENRVARKEEQER